MIIGGPFQLKYNTIFYSVLFCSIGLCNMHVYVPLEVPRLLTFGSGQLLSWGRLLFLTGVMLTL